MCGICGIYGINGLSEEDLKKFQTILLNCEDRGKDAFGYYTDKGVFKTKGCVSDYLQKHNDIWKRWKNTNFVLAHTRAVTTGEAKKNQNNHPFETRNFVLAHNGMIYNTIDFDYKTDIETDSFVIIKSIQKEYEKSKDVLQAIKETTKKLDGSYACWLLHKNTNDIYLFRHNNPIEIRFDDKNKIITFASEGEIMFKNVDIIREIVFGFFKVPFSFAKIEEHKIYKINKEGLHDLGEFEWTTYSRKSWSNGIDYDEDNYYVDSTKKHSKINSTMTENDIMWELKEVYGIDLQQVQDTLSKYYNICVYTYENSIHFYFGTTAYNKCRERFNIYGYTISPKKRILSINDLSAFNDIYRLIEEIYDEMEYSE